MPEYTNRYFTNFTATSYFTHFTATSQYW